MADRRRLERLLRLVALRAGNRSFSGWVGVVCQIVVEEIDVDGAAIAVRSSKRVEELVAVTGDWARELEELRYTAGEGPTVEAYDSGGPVLVSDLAAAAGRWPGFVAIAVEEVRAIFAFPLQQGAIRLGTLTLYRRKVGTLTPAELTDAAALADLATTALMTDVGDAAGDNEISVAPWARNGAPGHYDDVNVATGMVAAELRISLEDAFLRLRGHAFSQGRPLLDVARAVLERRLGADAFTD